MSFTKLIKHTWDMSSGTRVIMLKGRNKDGVDDARTILRISHDEEEWQRLVDELEAIARPNERLYCTASPRDMSKAIRRFKEAQLDSEYDKYPDQFYRSLQARWASALMKPGSQEVKTWLFDCDEEGQHKTVTHWLDQMASIMEWDTPYYSYETKNGRHILCRPFNKSMLPACTRNLIQDNALALLAY